MEIYLKKVNHGNFKSYFESLLGGHSILMRLFTTVESGYPAICQNAKNCAISVRYRKSYSLIIKKD